MNAILLFAALFLLADPSERPSLAAMTKQAESIEQKIAQRKLTKEDVADVTVADTVWIFRRFQGFDDPVLEAAIVSSVKDVDGQRTIYLDSSSSTPIKDGLVLTTKGKLVGQIVGDGRRIQVRPAAEVLREWNRNE